MMVKFWIPIIIRHLIFRVPKKGTIILTTTHQGAPVRQTYMAQRTLVSRLRVQAKRVMNGVRTRLIS